jgi:hypothetical protein
MAPQILNGVKYRIQNADFGTFLERRDKSTLVLRNLKPESKRQQWVFTKDEKYDIYELQNADDLQYVLSGKTGNEPSSPGFLTIARGPATSTGKKWKFVSDSGSQPDQLYMLSGDLGDDDVIAFVDSNSKPALQQDVNITDIRRINKGEDFRWNLVEVTPAELPDGDGKYRIRTLNGYAIHSLPGKKELSINNQQRGDHRAWEIKNLGNGKCTVFNLQEKKFLSTEKDRGEDWVPVLSTVQEKWDINETSEFTWSICIERQLIINKYPVPVQLSLSLKDNTVILKPMKAAHNQIWLIEATDAPLDTPENGGDDGENQGGGGEVVPGSGLRPGEYLLRNNGPEAFTVYAKVNNATGSFDILAGRNNESSDFKVELKAGGRRGEVYIYYSANRVTRYFAMRGGILVGDTAMYSWIVEQEPTSKLFYICDSNSPQSVLSTPLAATPDKFVTKPKTNDRSNLWTFAI